MDICEEGLSFITNARLDFTPIISHIMESIREYLYENADFGNPSQSLDMHFRGSGRSIRVDPSHRIIELEEQDVLELSRFREPGRLRGGYNPDYGKIILNKNLWCIETIYHEVLHSTSVTSRDNRLYSQYSLFFEGLTELYSGYLMKRIFPDCFESCWRQKNVSRCSCTYERYVKIWLGLCHFIPFETTYSIFFLNENGNWTEKWTEFIETIRSFGYPRFNYIIDDERKPKWLSLHQECKRNFGIEYMRIYNELINPLDLNLLRF